MNYLHILIDRICVRPSDSSKVSNAIRTRANI